MLDGVAEGSGVAVEEIYALNGRTELLYGAHRLTAADGVHGARPDRRPAHVLGAELGLAPGAAAVHAAAGHPDEHGFSWSTLAEAGMLGQGRAELRRARGLRQHARLRPRRRDGRRAVPRACCGRA